VDQEKVHVGLAEARQRFLEGGAEARPSVLSFQILVVRKMSERGTPARLMAAPTASSLPYISAVSMWR
jgi:hypothetical protein